MNKVCAWLAAGVCGLLGNLPTADAGVIYRWVDVVPNAQAGPIDAFIEFGSEFWSLGGSFNNAPRDGNPDTLEPYAGLERLHFGLINGPFDPIDWTTDQTCATFMGPASFFCPADLSPDARVVSLGILSSWMFDLTLGQRLSGSISINDGSSDFRMASLGSLFTITRLGSDLGPTCFNQGVCDGGTGYFELDASTVPGAQVPEPAVWSLLLAGLAGLALRRRTSHRFT